MYVTTDHHHAVQVACEPFGNCAATFINGSTAEGGNTAGDPLMKAEAQLRTP